MTDKTETDRDPLDTIADEAAQLMAGKPTDSTWQEFVEQLRGVAEYAQRRYQLALRMQAAFAAEGGQMPLIPDALLKTPKPRAKRRWLMHEDTDGTFCCAKCSHTAPSPDGLTEAARNRGIPCPKCNAPEEAVANG